MRHPALHQNPERIEMQPTRGAEAAIELGQHADGRWMWALSWQEGHSGSGYCLGEKWGNFAETRQSALDAAVAEGLQQTSRAYSECRNVRAWLEAMSQKQGDLFSAPRHDPRKRNQAGGREVHGREWSEVPHAPAL